MRHGDPLGGSSFRNSQQWIAENKGFQGEDCLIWPWSKNDNGYGYTKGGLASRIMCKAAHGEPPEDKPVARHLCGKGHLGCVNPKHLEWSTNSVNQMDRVVHGTSNRGQGNGHAKLSDADVTNIYTTQIEEKFLAEKFNVSITTTYDIKRKRTWKWLTDSIDTTSRL